jgi:hypothetical protein
MTTLVCYARLIMFSVIMPDGKIFWFTCAAIITQAVSEVPVISIHYCFIPDVNKTTFFTKNFVGPGRRTLK